MISGLRTILPQGVVAAGPGRAVPHRAAPGRARPPDGFSVAQGQAQGDEDGDQPHALRTQQRVGQQPVWPAE